jgi:hypothetical protein
MKTVKLILILILLTGFSNLSKAQVLRIYWYHNGGTQRYFYTTNFNELGNGGNGWAYGGTIGALQAQGDPNNTTGIYGRAVYRFYSSVDNAHYYTMNRNVYPLHYNLEGIMGYTPPIVYVNPLPVYEFYKSGDYYYSTNNSNPPSGYTLNGISYYVQQ